MNDSTPNGRTLSLEPKDAKVGSILRPSDVDIEKEPPLPASTAGSPPTSPPPPPNGGVIAWLQVLGGFLFVLNTWGMANSFGVFQTYYSSVLLAGNSPSAISWIGSIQAFLLLFIGVFSGRAFDAGYFYPVAGFGAFLSVFGMMMTSLSTNYYQIFLSQGLCLGLGSGCLFTPGISLVGQYFTTRRGLATGIAASGSSFGKLLAWLDAVISFPGYFVLTFSQGGIVFPIVVRKLIVSVGFPWAVRAMAFIMLGTLAIGISILRPRLPPRKSGPVADFAAFKDPAYSTFVIGLALGFMAFFIPFFYAESYALNIGVDSNLSFYILSIMNAAGMVGRLLPNAIADRLGSLNVIVPCACISAVIILSWISVQNLGGLIVTSVLYSFFSGGLMALPPAVLVALSPSLNKIGVRVGMALTIASLGVLIGSPVAGAILSRQSRNGNPESPGSLNYTGTLVFTGIALLICGGLMSATRVVKKGVKLEKI